MRLSQLRGLILIHKYGSISKAAQESFQSQSALSVAIKELEEELGYTILIRTKKGVEFTPYGLQVLEHVNNIFSEIALIRELNSNLDGLNGNVSLGTGSFISNILASDLWLILKEQYPGIHLTIHQDNNINIISSVLLGKLDLGLLQIGEMEDTPFFPEALMKSKLAFHPLIHLPMRFAVGCQSPLLTKSIVQISDLFPYTYFTNKDLEEDVAYQYLKKHGYRNEAVQVNSSVQRELVNKVNGFQVGADIGLDFGNARFTDQLYPLDVQDFSASYIIGWIHKGSTLSQAEQKVLQMLKDQTLKYL
ncbi:MAG: LysR family transcriptional regulator [Peptococcaceae bacterium]|nr:LysR family transcriptional regulator [Peptococcaceae bacterium]